MMMVTFADPPNFHQLVLASVNLSPVLCWILFAPAPVLLFGEIMLWEASLLSSLLAASNKSFLLLFCLSLSFGSITAKRWNQFSCNSIAHGFFCQNFFLHPQFFLSLFFFSSFLSARRPWTTIIAKDPSRVLCCEPQPCPKEYMLNYCIYLCYMDSRKPLSVVKYCRSTPSPTSWSPAIWLDRRCIPRRDKSADFCNFCLLTFWV